MVWREQTQFVDDGHGEIEPRDNKVVGHVGCSWVFPLWPGFGLGRAVHRPWPGMQETHANSPRLFRIAQPSPGAG